MPLIPARLAMKFGREVLAVPGNLTEEVRFAPNLAIKQGAKRVSESGEVIEVLPTPVRSALVQYKARESDQRNLLVARGLSQTEQITYARLSFEERKQIDDLLETTGLYSSEVLATLFEFGAER